MAGTTGALWRKSFVVILATVGCLALLLFCAKLVSAQQMEASWYGPGFEGKLTANGEVFDPSGYTAAHKTYAFDTKLIVTYEGRSVVVRINDRGPYVAGRELDLAQGAADYIGLTSVGVGVVDVQIADASTPVGPYAPPNNTSSEPAPEPTSQAEPAASGSSNKPNQNKPARQQNGRNGNGNGNAARAAGNQYASGNQYAAEDQYEEPIKVQEAAPEPLPPAPKPAVPVLPPEPEPEALLSPPAELAVPNSTVQKRVEFRIAAQPTPQPVEEEVAQPTPEPEPIEEEVVEPAPEPVEEPVVEPESEPVKESAEKPEVELTVLPDTGGTPLSLPAIGSLLVALGISVRILRR